MGGLCRNSRNGRTAERQNGRTAECGTAERQNCGMAGWPDSGMAKADGIAWNGRTVERRNGRIAELVELLIQAEWRNGRNGYLPISFMVHAYDDDTDTF